MEILERRLRLSACLALLPYLPTCLPLFPLPSVSVYLQHPPMPACPTPASLPLSLRRGARCASHSDANPPRWIIVDYQVHPLLSLRHSLFFSEVKTPHPLHPRSLRLDTRARCAPSGRTGSRQGQPKRADSEALKRDPSQRAIGCGRFLWSGGHGPPVSKRRPGPPGQAPPMGQAVHSVGRLMLACGAEDRVGRVAGSLGRRCAETWRPARPRRGRSHHAAHAYQAARNTTSGALIRRLAQLVERAGPFDTLHGA